MKSERVVFDTNVFISALLSSTSTPARALETAVLVDQLIATRETFGELITTLLSAKFDRYVSAERRDALLFWLATVVEFIEVTEPVRASRDPKDDKFLEAVVNGHADALVSGDRDLLALHPFRGTAILSPAEYLLRKTG